MNRSRVSLLLLVVLLLVMVPAVFAKTITVDGDGSEWILAEIIIDDGDDGGVPDGLDLDAMYFTNNSTTAFFRVDLVAAMDDTYSSNLVNVCLNVDDDASTGATGPFACPGGTGVDYVLVIYVDGSLGFETCDSLDCFFSPMPASFNTARTGNLIEIGIDRADVGLTGTDLTIPVTVTTLQMGEELQDEVSGVIQLPGPTAVAGSGVAAGAPGAFVPVLAVGLLLLLTGLAVVGRQRL